MTVGPANSASAESVSNAPLSLDQASKIDFEEADTANSSEDDTQEIENEPGDADDDQDEAEASDDSGEEADDDSNDEGDETDGDDNGTEPVEASDDAVVTLANGEKLTIAELKLGNLREKDYRHKTHELGVARRELETMNQRVGQAYNSLVDFLAERLPEEPDPSLAMTNPGEFVQRKAMFDAAVLQLQQIINAGAAHKEVAGQLSGQQRQEILVSEDAKLIEALPFLSDSKKRGEFNQHVAETAYALGYSVEELNSVDDHRLLVLGHYARLGMEAEKAKEKAAKKTTSVPPVTLNGKSNGRNGAAKHRANKDALNRLNKTGSIKDAMKIDFI